MVTDPLSQINSETMRLARVSVAWLAAFFVIYVGGYSYFDILAADADGFYIVFSAATWVMGFALLISVMKQGGYLPQGTIGGIGMYFGLSILIGFPVLIGALLFIAPGLYLAVRWQAAYARAAAHGEGVIEAMGWSWNETADLQKPLIIAFIPPLSVYACGFCLLAGQEFFDVEIGSGAYAAFMIGANIVLCTGFAWFTLLGIAVYGLLSNRMSDVTQTFE